MPQKLDLPSSCDDSWLKSIATNLECDEPLTIEFLRISMENARLFNSKQKDYGPRNISGFGILGVLVRMNDKMERLKTLFGTGKRRKPKNETIQDTLRDIANYGVIGTLLEKGTWPK